MEAKRMRFVMDEFTIKNRFNKTVVIRLVKQNNGDFRIKRGSNIVLMLSGKQDAIAAFEKYKSSFQSEGMLI